MATNLHTPSAVCSGVTNMNSRYAMTRVQVDALLTELESQTFIDNVALLFSDPIDNLIALYCYPFDVKALSAAWSGTDDRILISLVEMTSTGKYLGQVATPIIDLGSVTISRYFQNFLDFAPYTKIELYLPFIGFEPLDVNAVMGKTINIKYVVDLYSGKCTAYVLATYDNVETVIMVRDGQCGMQTQLAGGSGAEISRNMLRWGVGAASSAVSLTAGAIAAGASESGKTAGAISGSVGGAVGWLGGTTVGALNAAHYNVHKSGTTSAPNAGYGPMNAFLIYTRPVVAEPSSYAHSYGRPCGMSATLSSLTGYTVVDAVHVEGSGFEHATRDERDEIERLLKSGVLL